METGLLWNALCLHLRAYAGILVLAMNSDATRYLGIDVGSTTVKAVVMNRGGEVLYSNYVRHMSKVKETVLNELNYILNLLGDAPYRLAFTGSAGLGLSERSHSPFVQEVECSLLHARSAYPNADVAIELGGEDAKVIFFTGGLEERMNGSCAGGTGAFIDQMAVLLDVKPNELDEMALKATKVYPIASRCGVFAKTDVQAILNQGAGKEDVAMSIFHAVADQTIAGLAQGREIKGNVLFLGGPFYFLKGLRKAFVDRLGLDSSSAYFPDDSTTFVAKGAALYAKEKVDEVSTLAEAIARIEAVTSVGDVLSGEPLFKDEKEYRDFLARHKDVDVKKGDLTTYKGEAYLGIDEGSTTTKIVLLGENNEMLYSHYEPNNGLPIDKIVAQLRYIYDHASKDLKIVSSAVTGYGEELIKASLGVEHGLVETIAHFKAASFFEPKVDFILDIGGQDIKCFHIKNGAIDSIMLNEACSSGCGSFLQTFAQALGYSMNDFAQLGLYAKAPVELGSRCTVFMNSSVKSAQRDGASVADISAGLSRSVVKNALYKVIRVHSSDELGEHIVTQGGTFLNDAVLRCFEMEIGREVTRPSIAGLMGAFGAALYAKEHKGKSTLISEEALKGFSYKTTHAVCKGCTSHCGLTILSFPGGGSFISGNKCEKGAGRKVASNEEDLYAWKRAQLDNYSKNKGEGKIAIGLPLSLAMVETLPFWHTFFHVLGFKTVVSPWSTRELYRNGQKTIPSDTACYPAKLMHGHIDALLKEKVDAIFYPSQSYNVDEHRGDNHFHCPVVAYYGELLRQNEPRLQQTPLLDPFISLNSPKMAIATLAECLARYGISKGQVKTAFDKGLEELRLYRQKTKEKGLEVINKARSEGKRIIVLAGRPYHVDPEVNHGIDKLLDTLGVAVVSEDALTFPKELTKTRVLNQWTYHARLFDAAKLVSQTEDMELIHLVSFGCGVDAITTDEVRSILESKGKLYTQLKIDEMANLGAVKIRIRSLLAAVNERKGK